MSASQTKLLRGALIVVPPQGGMPVVVVFQYNPVNLRRKLTPQMIGGDAQSRASSMTYTGAPVETIDVEIEVDATDQPGQGGDLGNGPAGISPQLAAIEVVLAPTTDRVQQNLDLLNNDGTLEIGPYVAPLILFVWGEKRIVPVKITAYTVTEDGFDWKLNPIRASITLSMQVLSYSDVMDSDPAYKHFVTYQKAKEALAKQGYASSVKDVIGVDATRFIS
jgi:hypothetical protein